MAGLTEKEREFSHIAMLSAMLFSFSLSYMAVWMPSLHLNGSPNVKSRTLAPSCHRGESEFQTEYKIWLADSKSQGTLHLPATLILA